MMREHDHGVGFARVVCESENRRVRNSNWGQRRGCKSERVGRELWHTSIRSDLWDYFKTYTRDEIHQIASRANSIWDKVVRGRGVNVANDRMCQVGVGLGRRQL